MNVEVDEGRFREVGAKHGYIIGQHAADELTPEEQGAAVRDLESAVESGKSVWGYLPARIDESPLHPTVMEMSPVPVPSEEFVSRLNIVYGDGFLSGFCEAIGF